MALRWKMAPGERMGLWNSGIGPSALRRGLTMPLGAYSYRSHRWTLQSVPLLDPMIAWSLCLNRSLSLNLQHAPK